MQNTSIYLFLTSFIVSWLAIPNIIKVSNEKYLFDHPSEKRKIHAQNTPNLGGIAIFLGFYFSTLMFRILNDSIELSALSAASILLFFVSLKDDLISTTPIKRLFYQTILSVVVILIGRIYFSHLPFYESEGVIFQVFNMIGTLVFIVATINAVNFIDGVDGLAASITLFIFICFGFVFYEYNEIAYAQISLALAGSTLGFLLFNLNPAKIFMGDIGSMFLGIFIAALAIKLCNLEPLRLGLLPINNPISLTLAIIIVPTMDLISVILVRIGLKSSPLKADKRHTHHRLLSLGLSQTSVTLTLLAFNIFIVALSVLLSFLLNAIQSLLIILTIVGLSQFVLIRATNKNIE